MHIFFLSPDSCEPPHRVTHPTRMEGIAESLWNKGWDGPPLIGYHTNDQAKVVLLSGSHRFAAAKELGFHIPVEVLPYKLVNEAYGDIAKWRRLMTPSLIIRHIYRKRQS